MDSEGGVVTSQPPETWARLTRAAGTGQRGGGCVSAAGTPAAGPGPQRPGSPAEKSHSWGAHCQVPSRASGTRSTTVAPLSGPRWPRRPHGSAGPSRLCGIAMFYSPSSSIFHGPPARGCREMRRTSSPAAWTSAPRRTQRPPLRAERRVPSSGSWAVRRVCFKYRLKMKLSVNGCLQEGRGGVPARAPVGADPRRAGSYGPARLSPGLRRRPRPGQCQRHGRLPRPGLAGSKVSAGALVPVGQVAVCPGGLQRPSPAAARDSLRPPPALRRGTHPPLLLRGLWARADRPHCCCCRGSAGGPERQSCSETHQSVCTGTQTRAHTQTHTHMPTRTDTRAHTETQIHRCTRMCLHVQTQLCTHRRVYEQARMCMHTQTHVQRTHRGTCACARGGRLQTRGSRG